MIYLDLAADKDSTESVGGTPVDVSTEVELKGAVVNLAVGYAAVQSDKQSVNLLARVRYLEWSFEKGDLFAKAFDDLDISGPYANVRFLF